MVKSKNSTFLLSTICCIVYFTSYITRINFGAVISEICISEGFLKSAVAIVTTCSFISYGVGQIISGWLGEKIKPHFLIFGGLFATSAANIAIPFCHEVYQMAILWFFNGFFQSFMWPPLVKIISMYSTDEKQYNKITTAVCTASSVATIGIYLISPLIINSIGWRGVFYLSALIGVATAIVWNISYKKLPEPVNAITSLKNSENKKLDGGGLFVFAIMSIAIILQGMLRDGITTWLPSLVSETFNISASSAILTAVVLPVMAIISLNLSTYIQRKIFKEELFCAGLFFIVGCVSSVLLGAFLGKTNMVVPVVLASITSAMMHGANMMLICMTVPGFKKYGVSLMSGLLNSMTYIGSAISTYLFPKIVETTGGNWNSTVYIWAISAVMGAVVCFALIPKWKKFKTQ